MTLPGMSDGRCFTSHLSNCQLNENLKSSFKTNNNNTYRLYLQDNAQSIQEKFKNVCEMQTNNECSLCWDNNTPNYKNNII